MDLSNSPKSQSILLQLGVDLFALLPKQIVADLPTMSTCPGKTTTRMTRSLTVLGFSGSHPGPELPSRKSCVACQGLIIYRHPPALIDVKKVFPDFSSTPTQREKKLEGRVLGSHIFFLPSLPINDDYLNRKWCPWRNRVMRWRRAGFSFPLRLAYWNEYT